MAKTNLCCVCGKNIVCECSWYPRCNEDVCKAVYHICFCGAADGITTAKNSSLEDLNSAFAYLGKHPKHQKTLKLAIAREIAKRLKSEKSGGAK